MEVARGLDALDDQLEQRAMHARRPPARGRRPHDELREHRIVVAARSRCPTRCRHPSARRDRSARADARCVRSTAESPFAGSSLVMRHSIAQPRGAISSCPNGSFSPAAIAKLPLHEVDARHQLGDRMLDLEARVHLEEVELARPRRAGTRTCRRSRSRPRARPRTAVSPIARRSSGVTATLGASSIIF